MKRSKVLVIGAGPAGCVAGLTLNKLGHEVEIYERSEFPRYRIGESFLPGTLSILDRLGLSAELDAAGYVQKPSATFLWGQNQAPWTFSFTTPKTAPWVYDHAIQVDRGHFDKLLLDEARRRGVSVHENALVESINIGSLDHVEMNVRRGGKTETVSGDFVIDAGGSGGPLARQLGVRRFDEFYKNFAIWSYFKREDPFKGDLRGTTYSITFEDGWVWMIPLKGDIYSVGLVVDRSKVNEMREVGREKFFRDTLARCGQAMEILGDAAPYEDVRIVHDWSYDSELFSAGRFFLCGDSACFTDPLFSQGVHLATQSAVSAAAAIDRITQNDDEAEAVHQWYNRSYEETYEQYHEFLASFYTFASFTEPESEFWSRRRIAESADQRLERRSWFEQLVERDREDAGWSIGDFRDRASTMIAIGRHKRMELSDEFSDSELNPARVRWIGELTKQLNRIRRLEWNGSEVLLKDYYKIDPETFRLEPRRVLANERGLDMIKYAVEDPQLQVFKDLREQQFDYRTLIKQLGDSGKQEVSSQIVIRLFEAGLLTGYDRNGDRVVIQDRLRFDGVGVEYEV
ncbi:alkylhalidase cmlS [Candidatus Protofrankia californiensis]|uniref:Alkylhalidase cmlS n=1 Tax=Candidatus Protofrankia californiensis TaxID=1839754 RepID=A0A1C3NXI3_9ACTN|nr:alkylhalidase cmlS [Candidatus Protofrankia californiensis]